MNIDYPSEKFSVAILENRNAILFFSFEILSNENGVSSFDKLELELLTKKINVILNKY